MRRSGDLEAEQAVRVMAAEQLVQDIKDFRIPLWVRKSLACSCLSVIACISWCREVDMINKINSSSCPCFYISCETLITCEIPIPHMIPHTIPGGIPGGIPQWIPGGIPQWIPGGISRCCGRASWIVPLSHLDRLCFVSDKKVQYECA